jgi:hypothetical protein
MANVASCVTSMVDRTSCGSRTFFLQTASKVTVFKTKKIEARPVRTSAASQSGPNWVLDEPKRLWEIGSRYW